MLKIVFEKVCLDFEAELVELNGEAEHVHLLTLRESAGAGFGEIVTIKALAEQGLDDGLPANVEFLRGGVKFVEHDGGEVDIDALNGRHHFSGIGEKTRDVFSTISEARNGLGGNGPWFFTSTLHKVSFPDAWISNA
jgi:hypothetical protein